MLQHGGGIDGFIALLSFMPRDRIGMIVLTNQGSNNPVPTIVARRAYDQLLGLEAVDWPARVREQQARAREAAERSDEEELSYRVAGTSPSHELSEYVGEYEHPGYGVIRVELDGARLKATFNNMSAPLEHFHYDVFEVPEDPLVEFDEMKVMFRYNKRGAIDRLLIPFIVFTRVADPEH